MEKIVLALPLLACPVGMGLMMWFMTRGMSGARGTDLGRGRASVQELRDEQRRLADEIEALEAPRSRADEPSHAPSSRQV